MSAFTSPAFTQPLVSPYQGLSQTVTPAPTPAALVATTNLKFASTVSGAAVMGYGTTNDVSLMNRAGTVVLGIGPNTTTVNMTGLLTVAGFGTNSFSAGGTGEQTLKLQNTTAGVGNYVRFNLSTDIASVGVLDGYSSTYTTANQSVQSGVLLGATAAGGLSIAATHASGAIRFYSGGTTVRSTLRSDGLFDFAKQAIANMGIYIGDETASRLIDDAGTGGSTTQLYIGNASINVTSDRRLKQDITSTVVDAGLLLSRLSVVDYRWNDPSDTSFNNRNARGRWTGLIAQDTIDVMPWVVNAPRKESDLSIDYDSPEPWHIEFEHIVPVLVQGWQQHDATIQQLAARIAALETKDN